MRRLAIHLLRALLARLSPQAQECPQQEESTEVKTKTALKGGILVVDYTDCPSPTELDAIEGEFKELVDSLDLDSDADTSPALLN